MENFDPATQAVRGSLTTCYNPRMAKGHTSQWWKDHPEARQKLSDAKKGNTCGGGYKRTPETRARLSESVRAAFRAKREAGEPIGRPISLTQIESTCRVCHKTYIHRDDETGQFCSIPCRSLGILLRGSSYRKKALKFLEHICQRCGIELTEEGQIIVHHVDENRLNHAIENLQITCIPCHNKLHYGQARDARLFYGNRAIQRGVREILKGLKLDLSDKNLHATPQRVSRMFLEMFEGLYRQDEVGEILATTFPSEYEGIITHSGMLVFSMCPHHLLPVEYRVSLAYIATKTVGLSKLPRVVELMAKRPILQETLTREIAHALERHLTATAVLVRIRGKHSCMRIRGVKAIDDVVTTSTVLGAFRTVPEARAEALQLIRGGDNGVWD